MRNVIFALALALAGAAAWAARPFVTDDARLTNAGSCQLETWLRAYPDSTEFWALPACNPTGNLELTLGGGQARLEGGVNTEDYVFQLKTLFRPLQTNGWGWGLAVGTVQHPGIHPGPNQLGNTYAYVPLSRSFVDDRAIVHINLGWLRQRDSGRESTTWGLGGEFYPVSPRLAVIAETFGDDRNKPWWQTGLRWSLVPNLLQIDATIGEQAGGARAGQWLSFGLRWTP
jgi:hypothetical protein